jgi:hypothetical protein
MHPRFEPVVGRVPRRRRVASLSPLAIVIALCCGAWGAIAVSYGFNTRHLDQVIGGLRHGLGVTPAQFDALVHRHDVVFWAMQIACGTVLLLLIAWAALAQTNSNRLRRGGRGPVAAVLIWLIPVVNLIAPPRMLMRIRSVQLDARDAQPNGARPRANNEVILAWWLIELTGIGLFAYAQLTTSPLAIGETSSRANRVIRLDFTQAGLSLAAAIALLATVGMITRRNEVLRRPRAVVEVDLPPGAVIQLRPTVVSSYPSSIFPTAVHPSDPRWKPTSPDDPGRGYWS